MARNEVQVTFVGDSRSLERAFDNVENAAQDMAAELKDQEKKVRNFGGAMGAAGDAADASEGKFGGAADVLDGLGGAFGIPTEGATGLMRSFGDLSGGFATLQPLITTLGTTLKTQLGSAMTFLAAHPFILVVAGLTAAFVLLYTKVEPFRDLINELGKIIGEKVVDAFIFLKNAAVDVYNWVRDNWPLLLGIITGPIGLAVVAIVKYWDEIKSAFTAVKDWIGDRVDDIVGFITGIPGRIARVAAGMWDGIKDSFSALKQWIWDRLSDIVGFYTGMPGRIASVAAGMFDGIKDAFKSAINWIIGKWNGLDFRIEIPNSILGIPVPGGGRGASFGAPNIPYLADGGIVTRPTLAMIGEAGPEAVIPLGRAGAGTVVNIVVNGWVGNDVDLVRKIQSALLGEQRRSGSLGLVL